MDAVEELKTLGAKNFAIKYAGRKVRLTRLMGFGTSKVEDCIISGYRIDPYVNLIFNVKGQTSSFRPAHYWKGPFFTDPDGKSYGNAVIDVDKTSGYHIWIEIPRIQKIEFLDIEETSKKVIGNYPHTCPRCKGPAYVGFNVNVDCQAKCESKVIE